MHQELTSLLQSRGEGLLLNHHYSHITGLNSW